MNFTPDMLALVLSGTKTQTRRPVKAGEATDFCSADFNVQADQRPAETLARFPNAHISCVRNKLYGRVKWWRGGRYAVAPGRGKDGVARIEIKQIRYERACDISEADARAEGFDSREAFFDKLRSLYGANVDLTAPYWAITFELVKS